MGVGVSRGHGVEDTGGHGEKFFFYFNIYLRVAVYGKCDEIFGQKSCSKVTFKITLFVVFWPVYYCSNMKYSQTDICHTPVLITLVKEKKI